MAEEGGSALANACRAAYDEHAADYARAIDPTLSGLVEELVEQTGAREGDRVLDLATGTGAVARALARRGATVVGVDRSSAMLALARASAPELEFALADAHELSLERDAFDVVSCSLALSHFERPRVALAEVLRVLRPGGRLVASAWGRGGGSPASQLLVDLLSSAGASETGYSLDEATWLEPVRAIELLRHAGFVGVRSTTAAFSGSFADADHALAWTLAWPCGSVRFARLDASAAERFRATAREALAHADLSWRLAFNIYVAAKPHDSAIGAH